MANDAAYDIFRVVVFTCALVSSLVEIARAWVVRLKINRFFVLFFHFIFYTTNCRFKIHCREAS